MHANVGGDLSFAQCNIKAANVLPVSFEIRVFASGGIASFSVLTLQVVLVLLRRKAIPGTRCGG